MEPERWQQVERIYHEALQCQGSERTAFLDRACGDDQELRAEVESLLHYAQREAPALDSPAFELVAQALAKDLHTAAGPARLIGATLGQYQITAQLGTGGMGEVYRARDERLGRDVAIKVLPALLSSDADRLQRFEQEARAAAALNHPNILAVFQMGTHEGSPYLVSELLEGETLREQVKRGRLPVRKAVDYGVQIARGLSAAHEKGIVHRDLKPENLFATKDGRVKILDFGLAKLTQTQSDSGRSVLPSQNATETGQVMGTVGYMAPEQVRGQAVDRQADIFSFGAILYEMLTGKRAFQRETSADTMSAILNEDPPGISQVSGQVSPALERVIERCLEKNAEQRFQSALDLGFALEALSNERYNARDSASSPHAWKIVPLLLLVAVLAAGGLYYRWWQHRVRLTEADTIVLADFANSTGDPQFDGTLKTVLTISLRQSPFLNVVSDNKVTRTLRQMAVPAGTGLSPDLAQKLCQRVGSKAYITGAIGSLGSEYVMALKAVGCSNGETLAQEQITAASKQRVVNALGEAASKLRGKLGESLATVQRFDVPLAQATTSSLEALKELDLGRKAVSTQGAAAALLHDQRAIQLDPNFALGYSAVGVDYSNLGELERANEYITKAFQLREHASEREKLAITARYYSDVTGELEKGAQTFQQEIESFPRETAAYVNLGIVYAELGQYDKAEKIMRQALRLAPDSVGTNENLVNYVLASERFDQARQHLHDMRERKMDDAAMHNALYALAFLNSDSSAMAEEQSWLASHSPFENWAFALASDTEAYAGHVVKARELTKRAVESAVKADSKESAAVFQAILAQRDAVYGYAERARKEAEDALKLAPTSHGAESEAALALALAGDTARAESLTQDLGKRYPLNTQMQYAWLPAIQTELALHRKKPALALNVSQADSPVAMGQIGFVLNLSCMYPVYLRGEAYLAAGEGAAAASEFQGILDHRGIVWNCWTGALARLGAARANALQARTSQGADADAARVRALAAYKDFLTLWKDADPDIPIYKQAKAEYAKLQ